MRNTLIIILVVSFAYVATKSEKNKKKSSERGLAKYRSYRVIYATVVISVIISGAAVIFASLGFTCEF